MSDMTPDLEARLVIAMESIAASFIKMLAMVEDAVEATESEREEQRTAWREDG